MPVRIHPEAYGYRPTKKFNFSVELLIIPFVMLGYLSPNIEKVELFDKVLFQNTECFIFGRRSTGQMDIRKLDGTHISASANYKKMKLIENSKHILTERSTGSFLPAVSNGVSTS